jgi:hypothetical protein
MPEIRNKKKNGRYTNLQDAGSRQDGMAAEFAQEKKQLPILGPRGVDGTHGKADDGTTENTVPTETSTAESQGRSSRRRIDKGQRHVVGVIDSGQMNEPTLTPVMIKRPMSKIPDRRQTSGTTPISRRQGIPVRVRRSCPANVTVDDFTDPREDSTKLGHRVNRERTVPLSQMDPKGHTTQTGSQMRRGSGQTQLRTTELGETPRKILVRTTTTAITTRSVANQMTSSETMSREAKVRLVTK